MRTEPYTQLGKYLDEPYNLIWEIGNATGIRITDIITLKVRQLKIEKPTIREKKTGKSKRIRIPSKTRRRLLELTRGEKPEDFIFQGKNGKTGHLTRQAVFKAYKKAAIRAGTERNIGTHTMRKNYALKQFHRGGLVYVKNKLNHDNLSETALYLLGERSEEK